MTNGKEINIRPGSEFSTGEPGIYAGVEESVYHAFDACSNSRLSALSEKAPARCRVEWDNPTPSTDTQLLGRAIHAAILEPSEFSKRYFPLPSGFTKRSNADKEAYGELCDKYGADYVLKADAYECALAVQQEVRSNRGAERLLSMPGYNELTVVWIDEKRDLLCKARIDRWIPEAGIVLDLKSTSNAHPTAFQNDLYRYGYNRQAAYYPSGVNAHGIETKAYVILAVEKDPPYLSAAYRLTDNAVDAGWTALFPLLDLYAECHKSGTWPGYDGAIQDIDIPVWAYRQIENQLEVMT